MSGWTLAALVCLAMPASLKNGETGAAAWQTFGYTGRIPLKDISPGRYLLPVEAQDRSAPSRQPVAADTVITVDWQIKEDWQTKDSQITCT